MFQGVDSGLYNSQGIYPQPTTAPYLAGKEVCYEYLSFVYVLHLMIFVYSFIFSSLNV